MPTVCPDRLGRVQLDLAEQTQDGQPKKEDWAVVELLPPAVHQAHCTTNCSVRFPNTDAEFAEQPEQMRKEAVSGAQLRGNTVSGPEKKQALCAFIGVFPAHVQTSAKAKRGSHNSSLHYSCRPARSRQRTDSLVLVVRGPKKNLSHE